MDLSFLATQKATPKRSGWLRYFFVALALYPPVYVHAAESNNWTGEASTTWTTEGSAGAWKDGAAYADGNTVIFGTGVSSTEARKVTIQGTVAPGEIKVNSGTITHQSANGADDTLYESESGTNLGMSGGERAAGSSFDAKRVHAYMPYGYVFEGGSIADHGNVATSITKEGDATLVLNSTNTFSGGIDVQDGAVYLGAEGAAGTGTITLNTAATWDHYLSSYKTQSRNNYTTYTKTKVEHQGAELMVGYTGQSGFYTANITNSILLQATTELGEEQKATAHISYGYATYGSDQLPCDVHRNVVLSGGVFGSGDLYLHGYSYADKPTENYVSTFTINKDNLKGDAPGEAFSGTVYLKNAFNESVGPNREYDVDRLTGGAVQLNLSDDVFANATINLTRDQNEEKYVGWAGMNTWNGGHCKSDTAADSQTSDNILVLDGSVALKSLTADFLGSMWWHEDVPGERREDNTIPGTASHGQYYASWHISDCAQAMERWRVRVVTSSENNVLTLGDDSNTKYIFDGVMGFEQSYVTGTQTYINDFAVEYVEGDNIISTNSGSTPPKSDASFAENSTSTLGKAGLSLVKTGQSTQYIHSANLKDINLKGGTLGFNHLSLSGNLNLNSGTRLELGVTESKVEGIGWNPITGTDYDTNDSLTIGSGKRVYVESYDGEGAATVTGNVGFAEGASLEFNVQRTPIADDTKDALLSVSGVLTLQEDTALTLNFADVSFAADSADTTIYYLVEAKGGIIVGGDALSDSNKPGFAGTYITLGGGYYGKLWYEVGTNTTDYLTMTVVGDPRRTWSGVVSDGKWTTQEHSADRWKENLVFENGNVVLFGNLYNPTGTGTSSTITSVVGGEANAGKVVAEGVTIDSIKVSGFQHVIIEGEVAPVSIVINSDYTYVDGDGNESPATDGTNYYFSGGTIRDMKDKEAFLGQSMPTTLIKQGTGTAIIATDNSFTGGSTIEGGTLVMQHVNALGNTEKSGIVIQNGATLQGDFADGEGAATTTIKNTITVNHKDGEVDARLKGPHNRTLVVDKLLGHTGTVLELVGSSKADGNQYTYGVFEVNDASGFYGTVQMAGYLHGPETATGNVQLQITSSTSDPTSNTSDPTWTNATIDLSTTNANRTVLALNPTVQNAVVQLGSLQGTGEDSSVVNMVDGTTAVTLEILGTQAGIYQGALGYGDYQKLGGTLGHDMGNADGCAFNVTKKGNSSQTVGSAWLSDLTIADGGGSFIITEDLVVKNINVAHGTHLVVGTPTDQTYGLNVGMGGILAIEGSYDEEGNKIDAFAGVGAGNPAHVTSKLTGSGYVDVAVAPSNFIQFSNGATITAAGDWKTESPVETIKVPGTNQKEPHTLSYTRDIKIADGAYVTFNTHHYSADAEYTKNTTSHVMQMLGNMSGNNVHLTFNNENISAGAEGVKKTDNGYGYTGATGTEMGFVAIKDIHQFTGDSDITVTDNTVLQVADKLTNVAAVGAENPVYRQNADMKVYLDGDNAAIQFTDSADVADGTTTVRQYVNNVEITNGAHLLVGGALVDSNDDIKNVDSISDARVNITNRGEATSTFSTRAADTNESTATLTNLNILSTVTDINDQTIKTDSIGGTDDTRANISNSTITTQAAAEGKNNLVVHDANLFNSLVEIHSGATVNLTDAVLVDYTSSITGNNKGTNETSTAIVGTGTTVEMAFAKDENGNIFATTSKYTDVAKVNGIGYLTTTSFGNIDVEGEGLTLDLQLAGDIYTLAKNQGFSIIGIQVSGEGKFDLTESEGLWMDSEAFVITGFGGSWVTTGFVDEFVGNNTENFGEGRFIWLSVPEPTTATLSLLALTALAARRRRK